VKHRGRAGAAALVLGAATLWPQEAPVQMQRSLNELDRESFGVGASPFDRPLQPIAWKTVDATPATASTDLRMKLDGLWDLKEAPNHGRSEYQMLFREESWSGAIPARVPCSVQTALFEASRIEDPNLRKNNLGSLWVAEREWWLRRKFTAPASWRSKKVRILFDGVDYRAGFWLNGKRLGQHEGMYGGPDFEIGDLLYYGGRENVLVVSLEPAPADYRETLKNSVAYGWHYVNLITLGIWRSVHLEARDGASLGSPFLRTSRVTADSATVDLSLDIWRWGEQASEQVLDLVLAPRNFQGRAYVASVPLRLLPGNNAFAFTGVLQSPRLWWPVDMGRPDFYEFRCVLRHGTQVTDVYRSNFGVRTVVLTAAPLWRRSDIYNPQFVVNNRFIFMKGANWCYPDAMLRLDRRRQERFLQIARQSHIQYIRVWGGGPIENDDLYDLCDELGILVQQEFSFTGANRIANIPSLHAIDTTEYMVPRLRNRPSLAVWCAANEIKGFGRLVEVFGRRVLELDGTRDYWRSDPHFGKKHWYGVYWQDAPLLDYRKAVESREGGPAPVAFTEFGLSSPASSQTWRRILSPQALAEWPIGENSEFVHHTPTFIYLHVQKMMRYARDFLEPKRIEDLVAGMQLSQGVGLKLVIDHMRSRKPNTTQITFYKLTENYPASSWATIDYYGIPKASHYFTKHAYAPVHVMAVYADWNAPGGALNLVLHAVNDTESPVKGRVEATIFNAALQSAWRNSYPVEIPSDRAIKVGDVRFDVPAAGANPLFLCLDLVSDSGRLVDRDWSFYNFTPVAGSLFDRPQTSLKTRWVSRSPERPELEITNSGLLPAVGVSVDPGEAAVTYYADDSMLWLAPGQGRTVVLHRLPAADGQDRDLIRVAVSAWNATEVHADFREKANQR